LRLRRRVAAGSIAARYLFELGRQFVEARMNVIEFFARQRGLSGEHVSALVFAIVPLRASAAIRRGAIGLGRFVRQADIAIVFFGVGLPHQCAATVSALLNELVEPLSDRDAGSKRRVVVGFACFRTEASEVPRTCRISSRAQSHFRRERGSRPLF
jgi:hypothetical protein